MTTYKLLSVQSVVENGRHTGTLLIKVQYNFNGRMVSVDIAHSNPASEASVRAEIVARAPSELAKLDAIDLAQTIVPLLGIGVPVEIP